MRKTGKIRTQTHDLPRFRDIHGSGLRDGRVSVDLAVIAALDLSLYIDAALSMATVAAVARISSSWNVVASKYWGGFANPVKRKRRAVKSKTAVSKSTLKTSNDDDPAWNFVGAARA
jgi:hypothetical protein